MGRKVGKELTPANGASIEINGYYYDGRGTNILAEYEDEVWDINQYRQGKKNAIGNIPGGQVKYFNEYYYGRGLVAFNNMNHPNPWNMRADINFYHKDVLGSIRGITDNHGNPVERYSYDAYGNPYEGRFLNMQKNNPFGFTGQSFEPELRMYSFAYRTYNPMSMRWMTVDPVRDGTNWYQYVSGDPVNLWDPLGLDVIVLNDSEAVDYIPGGPYGHNAALIGNEEDGWVYYSKDGKAGNVGGTEIGNTGHERTEEGNLSIYYETYEHFNKETDVSGRYDRRAIIKTTSEQDKEMIDKTNEIYDKKYDFITNNCADLVEGILSAGDIEVKDSDKLVLYVPSVSVSIPTLSVYATVPNIQYENVLNIANVIVENGVVIREESSDVCKE